MKKVVTMLILGAALLSSCAPQKRIYKVTFGDGTYDYFELHYKPAPDAKAIEYDGETILGVEKIEKIDL